ncbi:MAG: hypothetical protein JWN88_2323, partial [Frankiales bacterium]|nr:hypothetical protein [Frankiales bacterium]
MRFAKAITLTPSGTASTQARVQDGHLDMDAGYATPINAPVAPPPDRHLACGKPGR